MVGDRNERLWVVRPQTWLTVFAYPVNMYPDPPMWKTEKVKTLLLEAGVR